MYYRLALIVSLEMWIKSKLLSYFSPSSYLLTFEYEISQSKIILGISFERTCQYFEMTNLLIF